MATKNRFHPSIIYQIFPDRFSIGNNRTIHEKIADGLYPPEAVPKEWDQLPEKTHHQSSHFFGGDLAGIIEKLDYIQRLGADTIYTTPFFPAPSYHKYDTLDYWGIDPALGDFETFERLIQEAHKRGIKIIIDIMLNHLSDQHPYFQEALADPDSKYRDYFCFTEYPETYNCWWGYRHMPELRLENPAVQEEFITGKNSVIHFWLEKGIDGIRLDCANDLGPEICRLIRDTARAVNPDALVIGEVAGFAAEWLESLDGVQSYFNTISIYSLLENRISGTQFGASIQALYDAAPKENLLNSFIMLSSHDYRRVLTILGGNIEQYAMALILQFTLPGVPMIYYGEEIGMEGAEDPLNRAPMRWDPNDWNKSVLNFYQHLIRLRKQRAELCHGDFMDLSHWLDNGITAYFRYLPEDPKQCSLILINPTQEKKHFRLFVPYSFFLADIMMEDIFTGTQTMNLDNYLDIEIEAQSGAIYLPNYLYKENYSFYKRV